MPNNTSTSTPICTNCTIRTNCTLRILQYKLKVKHIMLIILLIQHRTAVTFNLSSVKYCTTESTLHPCLHHTCVLGVLPRFSALLLYILMDVEYVGRRCGIRTSRDEHT